MNQMPSDAWCIRSLVDAYQPRTPAKYVVSLGEGGIRAGSLNMFYGTSGSLKTMIAIDMGMCVAVGKPWLHPIPGMTAPQPHATTQANVLLVDFDNGLEESEIRASAIARSHGLKESDPFYYVSLPSPWLNTGNRSSVNDLIARIKFHGIGLLILDNLGLISGGADQNSGQMTPVMSGLRRIAEDTGAAVVVIHHERKSNGIKTRPGDRLRGHTSIEAALDVALLVEREAPSSMVEITPTKVRGADIYKFAADWTYEAHPFDNYLYKGRFYGLPCADLTSDRAIEAAILDVLNRRRPQTKSELKTNVKSELPDMGLNRIAAIIDKMLNAGKLKSTSGGRNSQLIDLP